MSQLEKYKTQVNAAIAKMSQRGFNLEENALTPLLGVIEGLQAVTPEVLTTYPTTDASKAGITFIFQNELWRYLKAGETGLAEGTPWPMKGYKEVFVRVVVNNADPTSITTTTLKDDFNIAGGLPNFTRSGAGAYSTGVFDAGALATELGSPYVKFCELSQNSSAFLSSPGLVVAFSTNCVWAIDTFINGLKADGTSGSSSTYLAKTIVLPPDAA